MKMHVVDGTILLQKTAEMHARVWEKAAKTLGDMVPARGNPQTDVMALMLTGLAIGLAKSYYEEAHRIVSEEKV